MKSVADDCRQMPDCRCYSALGEQPNRQARRGGHHRSGQIGVEGHDRDRARITTKIVGNASRQSVIFAGNAFEFDHQRYRACDLAQHVR